MYLDKRTQLSDGRCYLFHKKIVERKNKILLLPNAQCIKIFIWNLELAKNNCMVFLKHFLYFKETVVAT